MTVGFVLNSYFYASFNGDSNFKEYLRKIQYKKFNASEDLNSSASKSDGQDVAGIFHLNNASNFDNSKPDKKKDKVIFYWNAFFENRDWAKGFGHKPFVNCEYKNCIATNDKERFLESDAMLCHIRTKGCSLSELPKERKPNQYWIFFLMESQLNSASGDKLKPLRSIFNLTMTFKLDSSLIVSYNGTNGVIEKVRNEKYHFYKGTKATIAWVVSNCWSSGAVQGRMRYISELGRYIKVKRYGRCPGYAACGKDCFTKLAKKHKFYFAAENSLCTDYITEKPWNALNVGMIPIVYGLGNYSKALPPHSYIDVRDFKHPRLLADYLKRVALNETLYNSYFKWREDYKQFRTSTSSDYMCKLCAFLNKPDPPKSIIQNLDKLWSAAIDCVNPHSFNDRIMQNK